MKWLVELAMRWRGRTLEAETRAAHDAQIRSSAREVRKKGVELDKAVAASNDRISDLRKSAKRAGVRLSR